MCRFFSGGLWSYWENLLPSVTYFLLPDLDLHISFFPEASYCSHRKLVLPQHRESHNLHFFVVE